MEINNCLNDLNASPLDEQTLNSLSLQDRPTNDTNGSRAVITPRYLPDHLPTTDNENILFDGDKIQENEILFKDKIDRQNCVEK